MRRIISASLTALAILSLTVSSVFAVGARIRGVTFSLGSLVADGKVTDMDPHQVSKVVLQTSGPADLICKDVDGHKPPVPAYHHPVVSAQGLVLIVADAHGRASFHVEAKPPKYVDVHIAGCPRGYEKALVDFVFFTNASIQVKDQHATQLDRADYRCETTRDCVTCKRAHH